MTRFPEHPQIGDEDSAYFARVECEECQREIRAADAVDGVNDEDKVFCSVECRDAYEDAHRPDDDEEKYLYLPSQTHYYHRGS